MMEIAVCEDATNKSTPAFLTQLFGYNSKQDNRNNSSMKRKREDDGELLIAAAKDGNASRVAKLLRRGRGINVDFQDSRGWTALHWACWKTYFEVVKILVEKGVNANIKNTCGGTPLHCACEQGHLDIVKFLIANGANLDAKNDSGRTPIHLASIENHMEVVNLLKESGADFIEVYNFQGYGGEKVPPYIPKLVVNQGVQVVPDFLCFNTYNHDYSFDNLREVSLPNGLTKIGRRSFAECVNLFEINEIPSTVGVIEEHAFFGCNSLKEIDFEETTTSPHQLIMIGEAAFRSCNFPRINPPSSVTIIGDQAFDSCGLKEANLSRTCIREISCQVFAFCSKLQMVRLPNTLECIVEEAFYDCKELVTVVIPYDSPPITIGENSFDDCKSLANFWLPRDSTARERAFVGCDLLHKRYGVDSDGIVANLMDRFEGFNVHELCYKHPRPSAQELQECIANQPKGALLVDRFQMNPFHILLSSDPNMDSLQVLLESLPNRMLGWKDDKDKRPLDYLFNKWTDESAVLLKMSLESWMIDPVGRWGAVSWMEAMKSKVQELLLLSEDAEEQRAALFAEAFAAFSKYEKIESQAILELALWKAKLDVSESPMAPTMNRQECRCLCGSDVVISNVFAFL